MNKKKILIIDDDISIAKAYAEGLRAEGFDTDVTYDGKEGMEKIEAGIPDLILLDMVMPVMNGEEVLDKLEANNILDKIPVLVVTNSVKEADMVKRKNYKISGYHVKSDFSLEKLIERIKELL